jgi:hypothetical protein
LRSTNRDWAAADESAMSITGRPNDLEGVASISDRPHSGRRREPTRWVLVSSNDANRVRMMHKNCRRGKHAERGATPHYRPSPPQFAENCTRNHLAQPTVLPFAPACSSSRKRKNISPAIVSPDRQHHWRAQISIACLRHHPPAALLSRYLLTRFRALALFSRR